MFKNKTIGLALVYTLLFCASVCFVFYGNHIKYIAHVYLFGLLAMFPFVYADVWFYRKDVHGGEIAGKIAGKEGLRFVVISTFFLIIFQIVFFETAFKEYKINYMQTVGPQVLKEQIAAGKLKITEADIPKMIATDVEAVSLFKEITSVIFKTFFYGAFCSFIVAFILKRKT